MDQKERLNRLKKMHQAMSMELPAMLVYFLLFTFFFKITHFHRKRTAEMLNTLKRSKTLPEPKPTIWRKEYQPCSSTCEFLTAVRSGDSQKITRFLVDPTFEVNIADERGRCPLQIAVEQQPDIVPLLIPRSNLAQIRLALFSAVEKELVSSLDTILASPLLEKAYNVDLLCELSIFEPRIDESFTLERFTCKHHPAPGTHPFQIERYDSPMLLAAINGSLTITRQLVNQGFTIPRPHSYSCTCFLCAQAQRNNFMHFSRMRILLYTAMTSENFLLLTTSDPIVACFEISREMNSLAKWESERQV